MGINLKKILDNMTAQEWKELYEEKTLEDMELINNLLDEKSELISALKMAKVINLILFIAMMILLLGEHI